MNNKKTIIIMLIFIIIFALMGGTFAYFSWQTSEEQKTNITFKVTQNFSCAADGGGNITNSNVSLAPATCTNVNHAIKRIVTVKPTTNNTDITMQLWLNVNTLDSGLSNSQNFKYALTTSDTSCETGVVSTGTFNGKTAGDKVYLLEENFSTTTTKTYYLYIWLDKEETSSTTINQKFELSLGGDCTNEINPEAPVLDESGMIPVTISETGVVKTISKTDKNWYNYKNKEWANVVLTTSSSRNNYLGTSGVTVSQSDILAYYVWIPRYKYQIWTTSTSSVGNEKTIEIEWESKSAEITNGSAVGEYKTHPAFWWDSDNDGVVDSNETLAGIWVGKFETTGNATTPTILPDVQSLRYQNVSTQFTTSLKFSGGTLTNGTVTYAGSDTYGLSNTTNSHMMKNNEWGAVAYLSHSIYGVNREIYINNSSSLYTGRSGGNVGGSTAINTVYTDQTSTNQYNSYGYYTWDGYLLKYGSNDKSETHDITKVASTTGNITGIYDMSGGAYEYVMGVLADSNGNPRSGKSADINSGFNGMVGSSEYTAGMTFPTKQYYDLYTSTTSTTACNGGICYGHALSETASWYTDYAKFVSSGSPWFLRGGGHNSGASAGAFYSSNANGHVSDRYSWRSALLVGLGR